MVFEDCSGPHGEQISFPTRRSSDLIAISKNGWRFAPRDGAEHRLYSNASCGVDAARSIAVETVLRTRSEEHTSELQSLAYLVCRLLLEKKKKNRQRWPRLYIPRGLD